MLGAKLLLAWCVKEAQVPGSLQVRGALRTIRAMIESSCWPAGLDAARFSGRSDSPAEQTTRWICGGREVLSSFTGAYLAYLTCRMLKGKRHNKLKGFCDAWVDVIRLGHRHTSHKRVISVTYHILSLN